MGNLLNKRMKGKQNTNGLKKNKQNINRKGQPKKGISFVNQELKKKGYNPAKKQDIEETYMSLLQLEESELIELGQDKTKPMLVRILVKNMLSGKGFEIIEKMLDRGIGKPNQTLDGDIKINGEIVVKVPDID